MRGGDVRNNTLTGNDINESSLGLVPRSNVANAANFAGAASVAGAAINSATTNQIDPATLVSLTEGQSQTLATRGPVTVTLACADADADNLGEATLTFSTTEGSATPGNFTLVGFTFTLVPIAPGAPFAFPIAEGGFDSATSIARPSNSDEYSWGHFSVAGGAAAQQQGGVAAGLGTCIGAVGLVD